MHQLQLSNSKFSNPEGLARLLREAADALSIAAEFASDDEAINEAQDAADDCEGA